MIDKPLQEAIEENNVAWVEALIDEKPQRLHQRDEYGQPPLIVAVLARNRSLDCIQALLDAGADVNSRNRAGFSALHVVIWNEYFPPWSARSEEIINLLLDEGAEIEDDQNAHVHTPLMCAVSERCCGDARLLLARGANPNKLFSDQSSLTTIAGLSLLSLSWLNPEMMQVLLEGGADVNLRNRFGQTALEEIQDRDAQNFDAEKQQSLELLRQTSSPRCGGQSRHRFGHKRVYLTPTLRRFCIRYYKIGDAKCRVQQSVFMNEMEAQPKRSQCFLKQE